VGPRNGLDDVEKRNSRNSNDSICRLLLQSVEYETLTVQVLANPTVVLRSFLR
jgi:hypothetical protein